MKTSIKIFAAFSLLLCFACGAKRSTQSKIEKTQQEMANEGPDTSESKNAANESAENNTNVKASNAGAPVQDETSSSNTNNQTSIATPSPSTNTLEEVDSSRMYTQLKMTDEQIRNFENSIKDFETRQKNMANGEMLGTVDNERERILKEILSSNQFSSYQTWKKNN